MPNKVVKLYFEHAKLRTLVLDYITRYRATVYLNGHDDVELLQIDEALAEIEINFDKSYELLNKVANKIGDRKERNL